MEFYLFIICWLIILGLLLAYPIITSAVKNGIIKAHRELDSKK